MEFFNKWAVIFIDLLMKDFDLSLNDAVAIVGNAGHESGGFKSLQEKKPVVPGSRGGYGIMQWTGSRRREYEAYCKRNSLDPANMMSNYMFLFVELKGWEGDNALPALKAAPTLEKKVESFMLKFLRPGTPHLDSRQVWAKRALAAYNAGKPAVQPPTAPSEPKKGGTLLDLILALLRAIFGR
jgi:hypothetical protein